VEADVTPFLRDPDVTLWHGDAREVLRRMPPQSVDATVTSPPYADARGDDYDRVGLADYPGWFKTVALELLPVTKPTGSFMLNLGRVFRGGIESSYIEETVLAVQSVGWVRIDTIIWRKLNALPNQHRELRRMHEYVYWFAVSPDAYRGFDHVREPYAASSLTRYQRTFKSAAKNRPREERGRNMNPLGAKPGSVFSCTVGRERGNPHPAPMALDLADHLVRLSSPPGGTVLDPFAGSATTLIAARRHNCIGIGIESSLDYCRLASDRLAQQSLLTEIAS